MKKILSLLLVGVVVASCGNGSSGRKVDDRSVQDAMNKLENARQKNRGGGEASDYSEPRRAVSSSHSESEGSTPVSSGTYVPMQTQPMPKVEKVEYESLPSRHGDTPCSGCGGSGNCGPCGGTGKTISSEWDDVLGRSVTKTTDCPVCMGTGHCKVCYGQGKIHY